MWTRFPFDPRSSGDLRAGDSDRETARQILTEAYAEGRIDRDEYDQRLDGALQAHHLGQLVPILNDIPLAPAQQLSRPQPPAARTPAKRPPRPAQHGAIKTAIFVVVVTNLVWLWVSISSGQLTYYWPMWPLLGMVIMLLAVFVFQRDPKERDQQRELGSGDGRDDRPA